MDSQQQLAEGKSAYKEGRYFDGEQVLSKTIEDSSFSALPQCDQAQVFLEYGRVLKKLARFEQSEIYLTRAKDIFSSYGGTESFDYSEALHELAMLSYEQSDLARAQEMLKEVLGIRQSLYQEPHKEIAIILHHIGEVSWKQGDQKPALLHLDAALEMQKQCLGEMHEDYADTLGDRSLVMIKLGKLQEAEEGLRRGLEIRKACLRPDHASIGNSLANLAFVLHHQRKNDSVEEMNREAIDIAIKSYGENSPRTATCINNLGGYFLSQGNLHEAAKHFERALAIKERILGKDNPDLVNTLGNLAIVYDHLKRKEEAQELRQRMLAITKAKIENSNSKDIDTMIQLADKLCADKKKLEARLILEKALQIANTEHGADSLKAAQVLYFLACQTDEKDPGKTRDYLIKALRIKKKHLGKKHPEVATVLRGLANILTLQGLRDVAELLNLQAQSIEHASGVEDPVLTSLRKKLNEARDAFGENDPKVTSTMRILCEMYWNCGQKKESNELLADYLRLREQQLGSDSAALAQEMMFKAMRIMPMRGLFVSEVPNLPLDVDSEDMKLCIDLLERAVQIGRKNADATGETETLTSNIGHLVTAYAMIDELPKAEALARESVEIAETHAGIDHWSLAVPLLGLHKVLVRQNKHEEAAAVEQRRKSLRQATRAEKEESSNKRSNRLFASMSNILQGLMTAGDSDAATESDTESGSATTPGSATTSDSATTPGSATTSDSATTPGSGTSDSATARGSDTKTDTSAGSSTAAGGAPLSLSDMIRVKILEAQSKNQDESSPKQKEQE